MFDVEKKRLKEEISRGADQEDLKRRDQQAALLAEIRSRESAPAGMTRPRRM